MRLPLAETIGFEPMSVGVKDRCVSHFTTSQYYFFGLGFAPNMSNNPKSPSVTRLLVR